MKTWIALMFFSTAAYANNCYVLTDPQSKLTCLQQAGDISEGNAYQATAINAQTQAIKDADFYAQVNANKAYQLELAKAIIAAQQATVCQFSPVLAPDGKPAYYTLPGYQPMGPIYIKICPQQKDPK